jgi:hypothetical protein
MVGGSQLLSEPSGTRLNVLPDSFINVNFINNTFSISITLQNSLVSGVLSGTDIQLSDFWEQNLVTLLGAGDFSSYGGEIVGAFAGAELEAIMSIISARSNLDEIFRGSVIWGMEEDITPVL